MHVVNILCGQTDCGDFRSLHSIFDFLTFYDIKSIDLPRVFPSCYFYGERKSAFRTKWTKENAPVRSFTVSAK